LVSPRQQPTASSKEQHTTEPYLESCSRCFSGRRGRSIPPRDRGNDAFDEGPKLRGCGPACRSNWDADIEGATSGGDLRRDWNLAYVNPARAHMCTDVMELKAAGVDSPIYFTRSDPPIAELLPL
jgi:hypothetical protein